MAKSILGNTTFMDLEDMTLKERSITNIIMQVGAL